MEIGSLYSSNGKYTKKLKLFEKKDWYLDVRIWIPAFLIIICSILAIDGVRISKMKTENLNLVEELAVETVPETTEEVIVPTERQLDSEPVALARLADSVAFGRSDDVKRIVMWVAINRSEDRSHGYGLSLLEEIARPKQWQQYSENATYLESTLKLAEEVIQTRDSGGARPIYGDMLWFVLNSDGSITVRNQFNSDKNRSEATFGQ